MTNKPGSDPPRIGLGLAAAGRPEYINLRQQNDPDKSFPLYRQKALGLLDYAYSQGLRDFDTAASYGKGEQFLQEWYDQNHFDDLRLSSKWGYTYQANWQIGYAGPHEIKEHSLRKLEEQWSTAKKLLPALKIYQVHSATFESGVLENREVLSRLYEIKADSGVLMGISVSGENQKEVLEAAAEVKTNGTELFDSFQVTYNILDTSCHQVLKKLLGRKKTVIVKEALANGRLLRHENYPHYKPVYDYLEELSLKYKVGPDAVALRFVMDHLHPKLVLSGASSSRQLESNLHAESIGLSQNEIKTLAGLQAQPKAYWSERKKLPWN